MNLDSSLLAALAVALLELVKTIDLVTILVAVVESPAVVTREVHSDLAVHAVEVFLLGVIVDTLATEEIDLCLVVLGVESKRSVSELRLLDCLLLGLALVRGTGGLLLFDGSRHDKLGLLRGDVRVDPPHEVPRGCSSNHFGLGNFWLGDSELAFVGAGETDVRGVLSLDRIESLVDKCAEHRLVLHEAHDGVERQLDEFACDLSCELSANTLLDRVAQQAGKLALILGSILIALDHCIANSLEARGVRARV